MQLRRTVAIALVASALVATAACGSRLSDDERALVLSGSGGGAAELDTGAVSGDDVAIDEGGTATGVDPAADAGGGSTGGDTTGGGDGGTTGGEAPAAGGPGACRPGTATSPGVTPTEIKVGNVSQITGLVPGFGQTGVNGVRAYFNMVNAAGGVCGRKLTLVTADDRFQSATNRSETEKLAGQVIAFVGSTTVVDDGGAPVIEARGVADISLTTTAPRTAAKNNFSPNPIDPTPGSGNGAVGILSYFKSEFGVESAAIFYQDVATGVNQSRNYEIDFQKAGIPVVAKYPVAPTATNFRSQATDIKEKGVDLIITVAEVGAISNLARALDDVDYQPKVPFYGAQTYGQKFLQQAGPAAEGTKIGLIFAVPESGGPAIGEFSTWYQRTAPGGDPDFFAILSWVAADMFVQALTAAGPDPTQAKILAEMRKVTNYTGDGLVGGINPAQKKQPRCFQVVEVKGGKWVKTFPAQGFQCQ
jgi:ABC-type branched-subunit amino acid transport system substrate-binding protein